MATRSNKIGEAKVEIRADGTRLQQDLTEAEGKLNSWGSRVTRAMKTVGAAIGTAFAAFAVGRQVGEFVQSLREASIAVNDMRTKTLEPFYELIRQSQQQKVSFNIAEAEREMEALGISAGNLDELMAKLREQGNRKIADNIAAAAKASRAATEEELNSVRVAINSLGKGETGSGVVDFLGRLTAAGFLARVAGVDLGKTYKDVREAAKQAQESEEAEFKRAKERLEVELELEQVKRRNAAADQLRSIQDAQRGEFTLGQTALDPTVLSREMSRIFSQSRY
jgi:hypothetical protein